MYASGIHGGYGCAWVWLCVGMPVDCDLEIRHELGPLLKGAKRHKHDALLVLMWRRESLSGFQSSRRGKKRRLHPPSEARGETEAWIALERKKEGGLRPTKG